MTRFKYALAVVLEDFWFYIVVIMLLFLARCAVGIP